MKVIGMLKQGQKVYIEDEKGIFIKSCFDRNTGVGDGREAIVKINGKEEKVLLSKIKPVYSDSFYIEDIMEKYEIKKLYKGTVSDLLNVKLRVRNANSGKQNKILCEENGVDLGILKKKLKCN